MLKIRKVGMSWWQIVKDAELAFLKWTLHLMPFEAIVCIFVTYLGVTVASSKIFVPMIGHCNTMR